MEDNEIYSPNLIYVDIYNFKWTTSVECVLYESDTCGSRWL